MNAPTEFKLSPEAVKWLREGFEHKVAIAEKLYEITGNPLHAWNAYQLCRVTHLPVPDWVLSYFDGVAKGLLKLEEAVKKRKKLSESDIGKALGMKAPGRDFLTFTETLEWVEIACDVLERLDAGDKEKYAYEAVAKKRRTSWSTVRRAWVEAKKWFPELSK